MRVGFAVIFLAVWLHAQPAHSFSATASKESYCKSMAQPSTVRQLASDWRNRISFANRGGLFNGGVCWWHSRLQRSALHLINFQPTLAKPSTPMAKKIINWLAASKKVVEIPGYSNLHSFSQDWSKEIQDKLDDWQRYDGFVLQQWIRGISGSHEVSSGELKSKMDELYNEVEIKNNIVWVMLQLKGISAHAWLITAIIPTTDGYSIFAIDSNYPLTTRKVTFRQGDRSLNDYYGEMVPYLGRQNDFRRFKQATDEYCNSSISKTAEEIDPDYYETPDLDWN